MVGTRETCQCLTRLLWSTEINSYGHSFPDVSRGNDVKAGCDTVSGGEGVDKVFGDNGIIMASIERGLPIDRPHNHGLDNYTVALKLVDLYMDLRTVVVQTMDSILEMQLTLFNNLGADKDKVELPPINYPSVTVNNDKVSAGGGSNNIVTGDSGTLIFSDAIADPKPKCGDPRACYDKSVDARLKKRFPMFLCSYSQLNLTHAYKETHIQTQEPTHNIEWAH